MILKTKIFSAICLTILGTIQQSQAPVAINSIKTMIRDVKNVFDSYQGQPLILTDSPIPLINELSGFGFALKKAIVTGVNSPPQSEITVNEVDDKTVKFTATGSFKADVEYVKDGGRARPWYLAMPLELTFVAQVYQDGNVPRVLVLVRLPRVYSSGSSLIEEASERIIGHGLEDNFRQKLELKLLRSETPVNSKTPKPFKIHIKPFAANSTK